MIEQASLVLGNGNWAVKSDSLLGYKTIDGKYYPREMTFTRATTGTRVNTDGLVELVPYNLLSWSEQFNNAAWTSSEVAIASNSTTAPDGTLTADTLTASTTNAAHYIFQSINTNSGSTLTFSCFVKNNGGNYVQFIPGGIGFTITNPYQNFDLINGTLAQGTIPNSTIENVGNGWYRISSTIEATSTGSAGYFLCPILNGTTGRLDAFTGNGTSGVFIWGAQLVEGAQPLTYLPTTDRLDIARIDYSTGSAALLLEPQRTNLLTYSEQFDNWGKSGVTITSNSITAPNGTLTADTFNGTAASFISASLSLTPQNYTISIYVKKLVTSSISISFEYHQSGSNNTLVTFNFDTGVISGGTFETLTNGWFRIRATTNVTTNRNQIRIVSADSFYIWGAQLEAGSYATSYIPTTTTTVTRNADIISKSDLGTYMSPQNNTIFFDFTTIPGGQNTSFLTFNVSTGNSIQFWYFVAANTINIQLGGVFYNTGILSGKVAIQVNPTNTKMFVNGVLSATAGTTGIVTTLTSSLGSYANGATMNCKNMQVYNTSLTDAECIALTTL